MQPILAVDDHILLELARLGPVDARIIFDQQGLARLQRSDMRLDACRQVIEQSLFDVVVRRPLSLTTLGDVADPLPLGIKVGRGKGMLLVASKRDLVEGSSLEVGLYALNICTVSTQQHGVLAVNSVVELEKRRQLFGRKLL